MSKKRGMRLFLSLALCVVMAAGFSTTAFAYADDTEQDLPVTEATMPEDMPPADETTEQPTEPDLTPGEPFEDEGNAYTRDLLYDKDCHKQFITVQTKNGNTFYIVIDYDKPVDEDEEQYQTYFLNLVDERDLMDLMEEEDIPDMSCNCVDKCVAGAVNTECPVCKNNMAECMGKEAEQADPAEGEGENPEQQPDEPEKEKSGGVPIGVIAVIVLLAVVGGGAYYYIKFVRGKKQKDDDLDFYDDDGYEDGPYVNEDEDKEPDIADDEEDEETEAEDE